MPEYAFPGDSPPEALVIALHVVLVCVSLIPFVGLFLQSRRRAKVDDMFLWIGVLILAPITHDLS